MQDRFQQCRARQLNASRPSNARRSNNARLQSQKLMHNDRENATCWIGYRKEYMFVLTWWSMTPWAKVGATCRKRLWVTLSPRPLNVNKQCASECSLSSPCYARRCLWTPTCRFCLWVMSALRRPGYQQASVPLSVVKLRRSNIYIYNILDCVMWSLWTCYAPPLSDVKLLREPLNINKHKASEQS